MPLTPEAEWEYWDKKAVELRHTQSESVNAAAAKWSALMAGLLGVFSAVAFAGGFTTLDNLNQSWHTPVLVLTTIAVCAAIVSLILLAIAGGGLWTKTVRNPLDGLDVKRRATQQAQRNLVLLSIGRVLSVLTVAVVVVGSLAVLWVGPSKDAQKYVATFTDKGPAYGVLTVAEDGTMRVGGQSLDRTLVGLTPVSPESQSP